MNLEHTKQLLQSSPQESEGLELLAQVLRACVELVSLPDNDFSWSSWSSQEEAVAELTKLLRTAENGYPPELTTLSTLFAPTGPLQEVSLSSGWAEPFLRVSGYYDLAESQIWGR